MNCELDEALSLLDHVARTSSDPTVALHALAAADALERSGARARLDTRDKSSDRCALERALVLLGMCADGADDEFLDALQYATIAHQATR